MSNGAESPGVPGPVSVPGGPVPFGARLQQAVAAHGPLCAGIDPHPQLLAAWGLPDTPAGLETFTMRCVEAFGGQVALVKPQSAFFERFGAAGIAVLERALAGLREAGTLSVLDVKRGDIGSTMAGYASAYLSQDAPLRADAITASPYLGYESLRPALDLALNSGRGVFVLTLTSNPQGPQVQHAVRDGLSVAGAMVAGVRGDNERLTGRADPADPTSSAAPTEHADPTGQPGERPWGSVGMVVGATVGDAIQECGLDLAGANAPLLAPGLGAQGATPADVRRVFGPATTRVLAASSRDVLNAGPSVESLRRKAIDLGRELADTLYAPAQPPQPETRPASAPQPSAKLQVSTADVDPEVLTELRGMRDSIDNIDAALVHLLAERFKCTQRVGQLKADHGLPPADPAREAQQIARLRALASGAHLDPAFAEKFLSFVIDEVIRHHRAIAGDLHE